MANLEHIEIVKQGTEAIAKFRKNNPDVVLYLRRANLTGANLEEADLWGANLFSCKNLDDATKFRYFQMLLESWK